MRSRVVVPITCWIVVAWVLPGDADGANCALRNPDRQIFEMFSEATSYRTVVAEIDQKLRDDIEAKLGIELHFGDLGKHTVYLVLKDKVPVGFVHARSEIGKSGSVELIWALDLDLSIRDFRVQRSREKHTAAIKSDAFRARLVGRSLSQIKSYLTSGEPGVDIRALGIPPEAASIAHTAVVCGAKCRVITEMAFGDAIFDARLLGNLHRFFPETAKVTRIKALFNGESVASIERAMAGSAEQIDRASCTVLRSLAADGATLGVSVFSRWSAHPSAPEVWWSVDPEGTVRDVVVVGADARVNDSFAEMHGKRLTSLATSRRTESASPALCAAEVLAMLAAHGIGK